jgi:macrolide transport system ATP-binding/permease protein
MRTWLSRCAELILRRRRDARLDHEVRTHLELLTDEFVAKGMTREDAQLAARRQFGGVDQIKERYRDERGLPLLDWLMQDVRFAFRLMRKNALFSVTAAGSLALSIGALTLAFSAVNAIVLKPLPIADPSRVYAMQNGTVGWSYPDYRDLRDRLDVDGLAGYRFTMMNVGLEPEPSILWGYLVTGNYFEALGVMPAVGRFFTQEEDTRPGDAALAVLAYDTWQSRFGGRADIVGSAITINGRAFTVTGVAPRGFHGAEVFFRPEIWVPMMMQAEIELGSSWLNTRVTQNVMGLVRLKHGVTREQAEATIGAAVAVLSKEHPRNGALQLRLSRPGLLGDNLGRPARTFVWGLFAFGVLLMLAGCSNLAGLLLARGNDRAREIALRTALGAGKSRIARQLLTESVLLAWCGGIGGAAIALAGTRAISAWRLPTEVPFQLEFTADARILVFATVAALVVGVIVGTAPARFASRLDLNRSLKSASAVNVGGRRLHGREILVCVQVALCVVLLHASFLAMRGLQHAATASIGWNPDGVVMAATELGLARYTREQAETYWRRVVEEARSLPGAISVTASNSLPLHIDQSATTLFTYPASEPERGISASVYGVTPSYFATLQIALREGRDFNEFDTRGAPQVAIVNRAAADRLFDGNALGRQLREGRGGVPMQIIGVVEDGKYSALAEARRAAIFRPLMQRYNNSAMLIVRSSPPGSITAGDLEQVIHRVDPALPIRWSATGSQITALSLIPYRVAVTALGLLGLIASGLLLSGLHAMLAYAVAKRQREIGIRVALGADGASIMRALLSRVFIIVAIGVGIGALLSAGTGPAVSSMVLGVSPREPALLAAIAAALAFITLLSSAGPLRRSLRVDPLTALRED